MLDYINLTPSQITTILKETFNQLSSVFMTSNFLILCPEWTSKAKDMSHKDFSFKLKMN
nr:DUF792 family protein [Borrelia duttonii]